jgi:hypothetical protein
MLMASCVPAELITYRNVLICVNSEMIQVWDSTKSADNMELTLLESIVSHERKELALQLFRDNEYHIGGKFHIIVSYS